MIGVRQSGMLDFSIAQLPRDLNLMVHARKEAFHLLETDPGLLLPKHEGLRVLMGLKEKEAAGGIAP
jgi:ATP-dependent DNA helicase RecG